MECSVVVENESIIITKLTMLSATFANDDSMTENPVFKKNSTAKALITINYIYFEVLSRVVGTCRALSFY